MVIGITGRHRGADVATLRVELSEVDEAVRDTCGIGLDAVLARQGGPVRNRPAERASEEAARSDALADARNRGPSQAAWFEQWLAGLLADGTVTRLVGCGEADQLGWAAVVLNRLPVADLPQPVLAEWATGKTKALSGTTLATFVLRVCAGAACRDAGPGQLGTSAVRCGSPSAW